MRKILCAISHKKYPANRLVRIKNIRPQISNLIKADYPYLSENDFILKDYVNKYRRKYIERLLKQENRELNQLQQSILDKISQNKIVSQDIEPILDEKLTLGQKIADKVAAFGGSWTFILFFSLFLFLWMGVNVWFLTKPFDPYPFILLNLALSTLASIQAPIIMMSQNRQEEKDRLRGEHDFQVNLKSEIEIQLLHEKVDYLISQQNERLIKLQEIQLEYIEDIVNRLEKKCK